VKVRPVDFVELVGFTAGRLMEDAVRTWNDALIVRVHGEEVDAIGLSLIVGTKACGDEISLAIIVPERTWIVPSSGGDDRFWRRPGSFGRDAEAI
jgi:hypothetical protein